MSEKKELLIKTVAGLFFIVGILIFTIAVLTIGKDKGLAQSKFNVTVLYQDVGGLVEGAPVRLSGVNVGTVASIDFLEKEVQGRRVKVELSIFSKYQKQLKGSAVFAIRTEGVLGEKLVEIGFVDYGEEMDLSKPIIGQDPLDVQDLAEEFAKAAESFTKTAEELSKIDILEFTQVMQESAESLLVTSKGVNEILVDIDVIVRKTKRLLDRIEQKIIDNELFKVF